MVDRRQPDAGLVFDGIGMTSNASSVSVVLERTDVIEVVRCSFIFNLAIGVCVWFRDPGLFV